MCLKIPTAKETYEESTLENLGELHNVDEEAQTGSDWIGYIGKHILTTRATQ